MNQRYEKGVSPGVATETKDSTSVQYVLAPGGLIGERPRDFDIVELAKIIWYRKTLIISVMAVVFLLAAAFALWAPRWYRAEILLAPAEENAVGELPGPLSGIASLAGITSGGNKTTESIAVLGSRGIARSFIEDMGLLPVLFEDRWNSLTGEWEGANPARWPDIRDAVRYFDEKVRFVSHDSKSGLVKLAVEWKDPDAAATWAKMLVDRVNKDMRARALAEAETNVQYLRAQLEASNVITMQQSIGRLLEVELQRLMLAKGTEEFAFKVLDPVQVPKIPSWPRPLVVLLMGLLLGLFLGVSAALLPFGDGNIEAEHS